jgi:hypothetical protein
LFYNSYPIVRVCGDNNKQNVVKAKAANTTQAFANAVNNNGADLGNVFLQAQLLNNFNAARNGKGKKKVEEPSDMNRESKRPSYEQANQGYNWQPSFHQEPPVYMYHGHYHRFQEPPAYINHGHHHRFHQESFHDNRDHHRVHQQEPVYIDNRSYSHQPFHMDTRNQQPIYAMGMMQATETEDEQEPQGNATGTSSHQ